MTKENNLFNLFFILLSIFFLTLSSCSKASDQKAYEEVVSTMSLEKAKQFFEKYPESKYKNRLESDIVRWCEKEGTEECYRMILEIMPKDSSSYKEIKSYYERKFGGKK